MVVGPHKESSSSRSRPASRWRQVPTRVAISGRWATWGSELERMVEFGMAPDGRAGDGYAHAAEAIQRLDQLGNLETGKLADLIVVDGNPLDDMAPCETSGW